jgi:hypothetical protein
VNGKRAKAMRRAQQACDHKTQGVWALDKTRKRDWRQLQFVTCSKCGIRFHALTPLTQEGAERQRKAFAKRNRQS